MANRYSGNIIKWHIQIKPRAITTIKPNASNLSVSIYSQAADSAILQNLEKKSRKAK